MKNFLIIQTAFIGDAVLTLPLIQVLKQYYPQSSIDVVAIPRTIEIFSNHPAISELIPYDKKGKDKRLPGFRRVLKKLKQKSYDVIIVPHRSLRSALLTYLQKPKMSIGFDKSAGKLFFTKIVHYEPSLHEIDRNLSLLEPLGIKSTANILPKLYPSYKDQKIIDEIFQKYNLNQRYSFISVAPGTVWNTKRWPIERFTSLCKMLINKDFFIFLVGGVEDKNLCATIIENVRSEKIINVTGMLSILQSAELIRRCQLLISNDSAPMHLAVAVSTPVIAIFGATVPEFGFYPRGEKDIVVETKGLKCRPCSIHGGKKCPIKTFDCMLSIEPEYVFEKVMTIIS